MGTMQPLQAGGGKTGAETPRTFRATPEVISQFLKLKVDEVVAQMTSVGGREKLFAKLMEHEESLRKIHDFNPQELRRQLEVAGEAVAAKEKFMKDVTSPEKKSLFRRAWDRVKGFPKSHPVITAILVLAVLAGTGAAIAYYAGSLELLFHQLGETTTKTLPGALKKFPLAPGTHPDSAPYFGM